MGEYLHLLMTTSALTGLLGMSFLGFLALAFRRVSPLYQVHSAIAAAGLFYGANETALLYLSFQEVYQAALEVSRLQQMGLTAFLVLIPLLVRHLHESGPFFPRLNRFLLFFGMASAMIISLFALMIPELFTSLIFSSGIEVIPLVDAGRGREGPLYHARNLFLAFYLTYFLIQILVHRWKNRLAPDAKGLVIGSFPAVLIGLLEILQDLTGTTFAGQSSVLPSPILWGLSFFSAVNLLFSRTGDLRGKMQPLTEQLAGVDLSGQRKPGTKALLVIKLEKTRVMGRWKSETRSALALGKIRSCLRSSDRLGFTGEGEAVVVLEQLSHPADAAQAAQKILALEGPGPRPERVGIALIPRDGTDIETLLVKSRGALAKAKELNLPYSFTAESHNSEAQHRIILLETLRESQDDISRYSIHYQPVFNLEGDIVAVEALLRWQSRPGLSAGPEVLIPLAEAAGIFSRISPAILHETLKGYTLLKSSGMSSLLSVNLTARQLKDPGVFTGLQSSMLKLGLTPQEIRLELDAAALKESPQESRLSIQKYSNGGFRLALDNFGLGFPSLLPAELFFDTYILDASLIRRLGWQRKDEALIRALVQLTTDTGVQLAAKGVETYQQQEILKAAGVPFIQGFFYSPALPAEELLEFARRRQISRKPE